MTRVRYGLLVILIFAAVELLSYGYFRTKLDQLPFSNPDLYTFTEQQVLFLAKIYNTDLGWIYKNKTELGDRGRPGLTPMNDHNYYALAFGDSFTFGTEVEANETWPYYLETLSNKAVLNFGMPGYGIDQILWTFQQKSTLFKSQYVLFGFISNDIDRSQTNYWRFVHHLRDAVPALTKPVYNWNGEEFVLQPNPVRSIEDLPNLMETKFISKLMDSDPLRSTMSLPHFSFPYSKLLFNHIIWNEALRDPVSSTWEDADKMRLLKFILGKFSATACSQRTIPVVILFPDMDMVNSYQKDAGSLGKTQNAFAEMCSALNMHCYFPLEVFKNEKPARDYFLKNGHYSAATNKMIASALKNFMANIKKEGCN